VRKATVLKEELEKVGFVVSKKWEPVGRLSLYVFEHAELLDVGFFAVSFNQEYAVLQAKPFVFKIDADAIRPTEYKLLGYRFIGIPKGTAHTGSRVSKKNPKRIKEFEIFRREGVILRRNDYINLFLGPLRITWLYYLLVFFLNLLGRVRVRMGKSYDFWR
jgi:hypothetical protein